MKFSRLLKLCFLVQCLMWTTNSQSEPGIIQTSSGPIQGSLLNVNGRRVYQYLGIPYAQPPLGDLRFRKPQPTPPWSKTLKANRMPPACIQYAEYPFPWYDFRRGKSENCLYLNMWVPKTKDENCNKKKKSVMFWIHGGGFEHGSIRKPVYNGRALAAEGDVIVVTINYRLDAFGFFTTNTDSAPVNVAKDAFEIAKTLYSYNQTYNAVYGNQFLPDNAREDLKLGKFHDVSVLIGTNRDEGSPILTTRLPEIFGFFGHRRSELNISMAEAILKNMFKDTLKAIPATELVTQTILKRLSTDDDRKNLKIIYDFLGDFSLLCPTVYFAESYSRYGKDVYFYFFTHRPNTTPWAKWMGVAHYEEVQFVFGSPVKENKYTDEEVELSKLMMKMWSNFAKYGYPLHRKSKQSWPIYSREKPLYLKLDTATRKAKQYNLGPHKSQL